MRTGALDARERGLIDDFENGVLDPPTDDAGGSHILTGGCSMFTTWEAVWTLNRVPDDVMGSAIGTATNSQLQSPVDVHGDDAEAVFTRARDRSE